MAAQRGIQYVNHTFKSHLTVAASLHVFASNRDFRLCEYPAAGSPLSNNVASHVERDADGFVSAPETPGLGVKVNLDVVKEYLAPVSMNVAGETFRFDQL